MWEIGYLMVLYIRLGVKIRDWHAKDSNAFCKRQMVLVYTPIQIYRLFNFELVKVTLYQLSLKSIYSIAYNILYAPLAIFYTIF